MDKTDCNACHKPVEKSIGPSFREVAKRYKGQADAVALLSGRVINGSAGIWGDVAMAAHPSLSKEDAAEMIKFILDHDDEKAHPAPLPIKGEHATTLPSDDKGQGAYIIRAAYRDRGAMGLPSIETEKVYVLRNPSLSPHAADDLKNAQKMSFGGRKFCIPSNNAHMAYKGLDLTNIKQIKFGASAPKQFRFAGGKIEVRLGAPDGKLAGDPVYLIPFEGQGFQGQAPTMIPLYAGVSGLHDVYFVFKNDTASASASLMTVNEIVFQDETAAAAAAAPPPPAPAAVKVDINEYIGTYKFEGLPFETMEILVENGQVSVKSSMGSGPLAPLSEPETYDAGGQAKIQFVRTDGKVSAMKLMPPGMTFTGKKM